ncbi:ANTAR domain-containing protein [Vibrio sinensis]|uniref:ANTAR domain-containing protein n=1 Tax=Vibrio sinensis TaxID=2302434 RepID=A0A3A6QJT9_9VIBR|nr:ANTAR domain-containing protein [Vibrio sinensis]RJX71445.1 ANTAR domain-containing protein [Vibrio sinensis]
MTKPTSKSPIIICSDKRDEQTRLADSLSNNTSQDQINDDTITCQLAQLEQQIQLNPNATVIVSWQHATAELRLIADFCRHKLIPLIIILRHLSVNNINKLPDNSGYVLVPSHDANALKPWLEHAKQVRQKWAQMESEIMTLTLKIEERKVVERAKGLLMKVHNVDEDHAYKALRNSAMQSSQTLTQVAKNLISTLELLA